jgi:hypothetical protein
MEPRCKMLVADESAAARAALFQAGTSRRRSYSACKLTPRKLCARIAKKNPIHWRKNRIYRRFDDGSINTEQVRAKHGETLILLSFERNCSTAPVEEISK